MPTSPIDQAFVRFQKTGDSDAMAQVFDATAPALERMAHYLVPDSNTADDLVQATFLTAIERRERYDPKRSRVLQWLIGILVNCAHLKRRSMGRFTHMEEALEKSAEAGDGPLQKMQAKELTDKVAEAIAKLPEVYQPVLNFHLRYGLSAQEIGLSLNRPAATVRKQITRGLAMLREALPASLIAGAAVLTSPAQGFTAMREVVIAKASAVQAAASSSSVLALSLWTAAGTLTAAALAVSLLAPDEGQVTFDELSPKATASVVAQKGSVDLPATASAALQAGPFSSSSRVLMRISSPVPPAPGGVSTMTHSMISNFIPSKGLSVPALLMGAMTLLPTLVSSQSVIYYHEGEDTRIILGQAVSGAGDLNADGCPDIVANAVWYDVDPDGTPGNGDELGDAGRVYMLSGKDGTVLWTSDGTGRLFNHGSSVANGGDMDGDGRGDVIVGTRRYDVDELGPDGTGGFPNNTGDEITENGRVSVLSGKDGTSLMDVDGEFLGNYFTYGYWFGAGEGFGSSVGNAGDVDGDGISEIVAGGSRWASSFFGADGIKDPAPGPDGTVGTADDVSDDSIDEGRVLVISFASRSLTADEHLLSLSVANSQTMTIDAGVANAGANYWLFTGFAASGDTPGVTMAPGVVIPLNQPDPLTSFVIGLTQLGGGAPTFAGWKSTLDGFGKAFPSLNTFGPTPAPLGITLHHAALVYTADGCGVGCDTFQLATNWVPMTTTP